MTSMVQQLVKQQVIKPTIKTSSDFGLFGGILSKLPPEIRRAGRDVLQTTRRSLQIGRVTGGRLFHLLVNNKEIILWHCLYWKQVLMS